MHIWQWRPTTPGIVSIRNQFLLVQWVDLPSLIHLCVGGMLKSMFFLSNLPSSIHRSSQLRYLLPITLLMCLLSTVIRSKRSKIQSQDILTHAYSFVSKIIQLRKERLVETGHGRNATNSTAQFYFQLYRQAQFKELRLLQ